MAKLKRVKSFLPPVGVSIGDKHYVVAGSNWQEMEKPLPIKQILELWDKYIPKNISISTPTIKRFITQGSKGNSYTVEFKYGKWTCTCPAYGFGRGKECKHIKQIKNYD